MATYTGVLVSLSRLLGLDYDQTVALPTVVTVCSQKAGMSKTDFIDACSSNAPLRDYVKGLCEVGASELVESA